MIRRLAPLSIGAVLVLAVGSGARAHAGPDPFPFERGGPLGEGLPNLVPIAPRDIGMGPTDEGDGRAIRFTSSTANLGDFSLELAGIPDTESPESAAMQCITWPADRVCGSYQKVGTFVYHEAHAHYHFEDFALYELRKLRKGKPDMRREGLVAPSTKASFCLIDSSPAGPSRGPLYDVPYPLYASCLAGTPNGGFAGVQGISAGWMDTYASGLPGQQIPIAGVPSGRYAIVVTTDPENRLFESNEDDNIAFTRVAILKGGATAAER
ncbi:MAG: lysyl oxidase family protein [Actinomycetota bacterium]